MLLGHTKTQKINEEKHRRGMLIARLTERGHLLRCTGCGGSDQQFVGYTTDILALALDGVVRLDRNPTHLCHA